MVLLHGGAHVLEARRQLSGFIQELLTEGAAAGELRGDVASDELAVYCLHALSAAAALPSAEAVRRLVEVTLAGLRPPPGG
jgi:Transcriptional regulator SbtR-like, C-terminal domain